MPETPDSGLLLPGLDGSNPLGFLAALGLLRTLTNSEDEPEPSLAWTLAGGRWVAVLHSARQADDLAEHLLGELTSNSDQHPALDWALFRDGDPEKIKSWLEADPGPWSLAMGVQLLPNTEEGKRFSQLQISRKDYHVKAVENLLAGINSDQLNRAIFCVWDYADPLEGLSLHLEPSEDRRHAYQWNQPAGDPDRKTHGNMVAANRLALEAYPLFPTVHHGGLAQTLGFKGNRISDTRWVWPLWDRPLSLRVIGSLLSHPDLQTDRVVEGKLKPIGVAAVFRSRRILVGKTPNLTPSEAIMA